MLKSRKILLVLMIFLIIFSVSITACKKGDTIKVAAIVAGGYTGESMRNAINMSVEELNAQGGILGKKLEIVWVTEGAADKLKNDLTQAIERDGAKFIVGGYTTGATLIAMTVMKEKKILWLGTGGADPKVVKTVAEDPGMRYYFRVGTLDSSAQGASIGRFAKDVLLPLKLKKVAYIRVNFPYALSIIQPARETMEAAGFETVIADEAVAPNATDFSAFLDQCKAKGVQVIVCSFLLGETTNFLKQVGAQGLNKKITIIGAKAMILKDEFPADVGGPEAAAYIASLSPQSGPVDMTGDGAAVKFAEAYKKKFNISAYWISYIAYDALRVLNAAAVKANSLEAQKIIEVMETPDFEFVGVSRYKWKKDNHDLYVGEHEGKVYTDFPWFQFYPDGTRKCVYPPAWAKDNKFLKAGQQPS
jgi:branched-chain amino acid transport system substrate-binding protein